MEKQQPELKQEEQLLLADVQQELELLQEAQAEQGNQEETQQEGAQVGEQGKS